MGCLGMNLRCFQLHANINILLTVEVSLVQEV